MKDALKDLFGISHYPLNRKMVIDLGSVMPLFSLILKGFSIEIVKELMVVIMQVTRCQKSEEGFGKVSSIRVLVDLLEGVTGLSIWVKERMQMGAIEFGEVQKGENNRRGGEWKFKWEGQGGGTA